MACDDSGHDLPDSGDMSDSGYLQLARLYWLAWVVSSRGASVMVLELLSVVYYDGDFDEFEVCLCCGDSDGFGVGGLCWPNY